MLSDDSEVVREPDGIFSLYLGSNVIRDSQYPLDRNGGKVSVTTIGRKVSVHPYSEHLEESNDGEILPKVSKYGGGKLIIRHTDEFPFKVDDQVTITISPDNGVLEIEQRDSKI